MAVYDAYVCLQTEAICFSGCVLLRGVSSGFYFFRRRSVHWYDDDDDGYCDLGEDSQWTVVDFRLVHNIMDGCVFFLLVLNIQSEVLIRFANVFSDV